MEKDLTEQEMHYLAMNIVGEDLKAQGFEFLAVNSKLKKHPQFVAQKEKEVHFIMVKAVRYPDNVETYDEKIMEKVKKHALKFDAKTYYAGVGLGHGEDYGKPPLKDEPYTVVYNGLMEIK